jgi:hypothetical protein
MIGTEVFHSTGLPAPRVAHANVSLNDRALGIFILKEGFTEDFLTRHFGTPLGFLYDASEAPTDNPPQMEIDIGDPASARAKLSALTAAADETERTQRFQKLSALLDIDSFAKFLALETIICHWDGYALSENNFRLYFQQANHRFHLLPTGMDQIFSKPDLPWDAPMGGHLARAFLDTPEGAKLFRHQLESLLARSLNPPELSNRISELRTLLRPYLTGSDHLVLVRETDLLASRIHQRAASLQAQLNTTNLYAPDFVDGEALLVHWLPFDEPPGGSLSSSPSALRIVAGPKTSASWQCKVTLKPGTYAFSTGVSTREVAPLPFGTTHGASLRILGQPQQSAPLLGSSKRPLRCEFQVTDPQQVTLVCQLRASQGEAIFDLPILLELLQNK